MRKFFITGGTGFIGREVVKKIQTLGQCYILTRHPRESVSGLIYLQGDIQDTVFLKDVFRNIHPTDLVHLAWDVKVADFASSPVNAKWVKWSTELVRAFLESGGQTVIASGTCFEYDLSERNILTEKSACWPATFYGMAKLLTYERISALCKEYDARFAWGRIFYPYGPGEEKRKFITSVIETLKSGGIVTCRTPQNEIDYIHVEDVGGMFSKLAENPSAHGIYNICTGNAVKIQRLLEIIEDIFSTETLINCQLQDEVDFIVGNNKKILDLGYHMKYDLCRGLKTYLNGGR